MATKSYTKRFGDRKEGRQIRSTSAEQRLAPYIMRRRSDACCSYADSVEVSAIAQWLLAKRQEGCRTMGLLHLIAAAYIRTVSQYPAVNRFIAGRHLFARSDIALILSVQRGQSADASHTPVKVFCSPNDTVYDVYSRINDVVDEVQAGTGETGLSKLAGVLVRIPRLFLRWIAALLRLMDYFDWLPRSVLDYSPFHGSLAISNMGLLGVQPVTHHISDFGTLPCFLSIGTQRRARETDADGSVTERRYVDYRFTCDERIADVGILAEALKYFRYLLSNPALLEQPPEHSFDDVN